MRFSKSRSEVRFLLVIMSALALLCAGNFSVAQEEEESRFANAQTTRVKALSTATAKKLEPIRELLAPEVEEGEKAPDPDAAGALRLLNRLRIGELPGHEKAEIYNIYGYVYYLLDDSQKALEYYQRIVNEPEANGPLVTRMLKQIAQICASLERFDCALQRMKQWMSTQDIVGPSDHYFLAIVYYNLDDINNALKHTEIAIDIREDAGRIGQQSWYALQKSIYYQRNDYRKVISILEKLIINYPDVRNWRELGGMYGELEDADGQMNAYAVTYLQDGGLTSSAQLVGLAYMYIAADAPYKGAEILVDGLKAGRVDRTETNLQLIGSAYYQARDLDKALPYMEQAAQKATDGESFGRLAGIYLDLERYDDSIRTGKEALRRRGVKRPDLVRMTVGTAQFQQKKYDEAISTMNKITDERTVSSRDQWIRYIENEAKREQQIRDSGIDLDKILGRS